MWVRPFFAWYDLWVGAYWDQVRRVLYLLPFPCIGLRVDFKQPRLPDTPAEPVDDWGVPQ